MSNDQTISDYTNRDYSSLLASLLELASLKLPEWTDRSENDMGRMLLESFAYIGDIILYYQDRIANEAFLSTAIERRSVIDLLSLIGYTLATPSPASIDLTLTLPNDDKTSVNIEVGAKFATQALPGKPAIEFIYIPITGQKLEIERNGSGRDIVYQKLTVINAARVSNEPLGTSSGEANQGFILKSGPVILSREPNSNISVQVEIDFGGGFEKWEKQETLLYSDSKAKHYIVTVNENDEAWIIFGDGKFGMIPPAGSSIRASYFYGGGEAGNVGPNTITKVMSGVSVPVKKVTNPLAASGGADRESIDHAKKYAPSIYRSRGRAVTMADYVALAESIPGVARAIAKHSAWNYVDIYVVAKGSLIPIPSAELCANILRYFEDKRMVTTLLSVRRPSFLAITIIVNVDIEPSFYRTDVQRRVENALNSLFDINQLNFGQTFYVSKIYEVIESVNGVSSSFVTNFISISYNPSYGIVKEDDNVSEEQSLDGILKKYGYVAKASVENISGGRIKLSENEFPLKDKIIVDSFGGLL